MNFTPECNHITVTLPNAHPLTHERGYDGYNDAILKRVSTKHLRNLDEFLDDDSVRGVEEYDVTLSGGMMRHRSVWTGGMALSIPDAILLLANAYRIADTSEYTRTVIDENGHRVVYAFGDDQTSWDAINLLYQSRVFAA